MDLTMFTTHKASITVEIATNLQKQPADVTLTPKSEYNGRRKLTGKINFIIKFSLNCGYSFFVSML